MTVMPYRYLLRSSPFETVGKLDCYMNYLGCKAVYNA